MDTAAIFREVMADARSAFAQDHHERPNDLFDFQLATGNNSGPDAASAAQAIDNALYRIANGDELRGELTEPGDPAAAQDPDNPATWPAVIRKRRLRTRLQPHFDTLVDDCKQGQYKGVSREESGPVRRIR
ncbi:hypothetical protein ACWC9H_27265 [Streptomyces sp. NPDC001251]